MRKHNVRQAAKLSCALALILCVSPHASRADSFQSATYDPATDELVIVVVYHGTSADHQFSLEWERCIDRGDNRRTIVARLLDQQFQDAARQDFTKTVRMSLADMNCRPATVTLSTPPGFHMTVEVPPRATGASKP
jgi:hypothetical protein